MVAAVQAKTYDFSYSLHGENAKTFRLIETGKEPVFANRSKGFEGMAWIEDADGATGHMRMTMATDTLNSGEMIFYLPDGYVEERMRVEGITVPADADFAELNQLCFARKQAQWRTWDKAQREGTMQYVDRYYGPAYVSWHDGGGHIFVHGRRWFQEIAGRRVAMFAGDKP